MSVVDELERKIGQLLSDPGNARLYNEIGVILYQLKDRETARMYFEKAYQLNRTEQDILYHYGQLLYENDKWDEAIGIFDAYLELDGNDPKVISKAGDACYLSGNYEKASALNEKLLLMKGESYEK